jgi:hypothetical protein
VCRRSNRARRYARSALLTGISNGEGKPPPSSQGQCRTGLRACAHADASACSVRSRLVSS